MRKVKGIASLVCICFILAMVACAGPAPTTPTTPTTPTAPTTPTTPTTVPAEVLTLKFQTNVDPVASERDYGEFLNAIETMTDGRLTIEMYAMGVLVPMSETLDAVAERVIDMAGVNEGYFSGPVPVSEIAGGLPFSYTNRDEASIFEREKGFLIYCGRNMPSIIFTLSFSAVHLSV